MKGGWQLFKPSANGQLSREGIRPGDHFQPKQAELLHVTKSKKQTNKKTDEKQDIFSQKVIVHRLLDIKEVGNSNSV